MTKPSLIMVTVGWIWGIGLVMASLMVVFWLIDLLGKALFL